MLRLLKHLGSACWGDHEWIYRTGERGLWLECRHCGLESAGLDAPTARYHRTQEAPPDAHRLVSRTSTEAVASAPGTSAAPRPTAAVSRMTPRMQEAAAVPGLSEGERRWLQLWRSLTADERSLAERLVARLPAQRDAVRHAS